MAFLRVRGGKIEVSYAYNGQCSSVCDAICESTGVAPGVVLWITGKGTLEGVRKKWRW